MSGLHEVQTGSGRLAGKVALVTGKPERVLFFLWSLPSPNPYHLLTLPPPSRCGLRIRSRNNPQVCGRGLQSGRNRHQQRRARKSLRRQFSIRRTHRPLDCQRHLGGRLGQDRRYGSIQVRRPGRSRQQCRDELQEQANAGRDRGRVR